MPGELIELFVDKSLARRVLTKVQDVIMTSFVDDRSRITRAETVRRFKIVETLFRELRAEGWPHQRILDVMPEALRHKLDGTPWEPDFTRNVWQPSGNRG